MQANIAGLSKDLKTNISNRYNVLAMIFFVGYCLVDIPAAFVVRKVGPALWLGTIGTIWGVITICQGFCKTWGELALCRALLGFLEGGLVPAAMMLLSVWYTRYEIQVRIAGFYVIGNASSGLAGLLAYGIERMAGDDNLDGWSWIFIIVTFCSALPPLHRSTCLITCVGRDSQHSCRPVRILHSCRLPRKSRRQELAGSSRIPNARRGSHCPSSRGT